MDNCAYQAYHCNVNHYGEACPRSSYMDRIEELVNTTKLPPQTVFHDGIKYAPVDKAPLRVCREMHQTVGPGTYADLPYFEDSDLSSASHFQTFLKNEKKNKV